MADKEMQFMLYQAEQEQISVNALIRDDNIWLTQKAMADLVGVDKSGISRHLKISSRKKNWSKKWWLQKLQYPLSMKLFILGRHTEEWGFLL